MTLISDSRLNAAAALILNQNPALGAEAAAELARAVLNVKAPAADPVAGPPPMPRLDVAALANAIPAQRAAAWMAHEKALSEWIPARTSYAEPVTEDAQRARDKLAELRTQAEAATDAEKVQRALDREKLMEVIIAGGMARL
jgi:hypothetical protein